MSPLRRGQERLGQSQPGVIVIHRKRLTAVGVVAQQKARRFPKANWTKRGHHRCHSMPEEPLRFVDIVDTLATTTYVLGKKGANVEASRPNAKN